MLSLYVDTNVFLDALLGRKSLTGRDLSKIATKFFHRAISCEFYIIISSWTLQELYKEVDVSQVKMLFKMLERKIKTVEHSEGDIEKAKKISNEHFQDALHALLAVKNKADFVVTRNLTDYSCTNNLIKAKLPEHI